MTSRGIMPAMMPGTGAVEVLAQSTAGVLSMIPKRGYRFSGRKRDNQRI